MAFAMIEVVVLWLTVMVLGQTFRAAKFLPEILAFILAGVLLGPTCLSFIQLAGPGPGSDATLLSGLHWVTLVLLMLSAGMNLPVGGSIRFTGRVSLILALSGLAAVLPALLLQAAFPSVIHDAGVPAGDGHQAAYRFVMALAVAVTSVPFLSKIFMDTGMIRSPFAREVLVAAALIDLAIWSLFPVAESLRASSTFGPAHLWKPLATILFAAVFGHLGPRLCAAAADRPSLGGRRWLPIAFILTFCFAIVGIGSLLEVNAMISATIAGISVATVRKRIDDAATTLERLIARFSTPLYFGLVGCSVDISALGSARLIAVFVTWSSVLKIGCVLLGMLLLAPAGKRREVSCYAVVMNTRGGPGIVLAVVARGAGLIGGETFVSLIMASILTSWLSEAWLRIDLRRRVAAAPSLLGRPRT